MNTSPITNSDDIIDSREVLGRIEVLQGTEDQDELDELEALTALIDQIEDPEDGICLVNEDYFEEHTQQMIDDCYPDLKDRYSGSWPYYCLKFDIEMAARDHKMDYTSIEFDGQTYWYRA
jgi:hypothetical protein